MMAKLRALFILLVTLSFLFNFSPVCNLSKAEENVAPSDNLKDSVALPAATQTGKTEMAKKEAALSSELITVNFENSDISEVIRILSEKSGLNIVVGPDVKATVNLQLIDVPWEKALDVILRTYNLTYKKEPGLIRVMTLEQLKLEEEKVPLTTKIVVLNFARAEDVKTSFNSMLSARGKIETNARTNSLIITDLPENIVKIENVVTQLDSRTPQVMIETMMADVTMSTEDDLGIQWTFARNKSRTPYLAETTHPTGETLNAVGKSALVNVTQGLAGSLLPTTSAMDILFGQTILNSIDLTATLRAWQERKRVNILAHPIIMTLDNQLAHIELMAQIPYTQQTQSTQASAALSSTAFKDAGIKLDVTPHITTKDNYISMNLKVEQTFLSGYTPDSQPIIDGRKAETNLLVKDGETIIIGGLRKKQDTITIDKVPFLGDVPILGVFFRKTLKSVSDVDLLIFVTPTVIKEPKMTSLEEGRLKLFERTPDEEKKFEFYDKKESKDKIKKEEVFTLRPPS